MDQLVHRGYAAQLLRTDVRSLYARRRPGFPLLMGMGAILFAGHLGLRTVCYGARCGVRSIGAPALADVGLGGWWMSVQEPAMAAMAPMAPGRRTPLPSWRRAFAAAGLWIDLPTAGANDYFMVRLAKLHSLEAAIGGLCEHGRACGACKTCWYYRTLGELPSSLATAWEECRSKHARLCEVARGDEKPSDLAWALLLRTKQEAPPAVWSALADAAAQAQRQKHLLHPDNFRLCHRSPHAPLIRAGWQRLLRIPQAF